MKHIIFCLLLVATCLLGACVEKTPYVEGPEPSDEQPLPDVCAGEWAFADDAASFSFGDETCGVSLQNATLRLLYADATGEHIVKAADYPTRVASPTAYGWRWTLQGLTGAPTIVVDVILDDENHSAKLRARLTRPSGNTGAWRLKWVELPSAKQAGQLVTVPGVDGQAAWLQNAYDAWSFTGVEHLLDVLEPPRAQNGTVAPCANNYDYWSTCAGFSWWSGAIGGKDRRAGLLWGALAARSWKTYGAGWFDAPAAEIHFVVVQGTPGDARAVAPGQTIELEPIWLMIAARPPYDLRQYALAAAAETPPPALPDRAPFGWSTWYDYFSNIDADIVRDNCARLKELYPDEPDLVCQIDDGYETLFGEWTTYTEGFPDGLAPVAADLNAMGLRAGVWIAPLIVDERSDLIEAHPEWFLVDAEGQAVRWVDQLAFRSFRLLDVTVPAVAELLADLIALRRDEGFTYFKLDFLFGGAFEGRRADGSTTMEAYRRAMAIMREAAGEDAFLVACGQPWLPSLGHFHAARGSSDVAGSFPGVPLFTTVANLARYHGARAFVDDLWFHYDPDNLVVRAPLTAPQAEATLAMTYLSGSTLLGDSLLELPADRQQWLTAPAAETLRATTGHFWAADLLADTVMWPIATPTFDLIGWANAAPQVWVRQPPEGGLIVALFAWEFWPQMLQFTDHDLAADFSGGVTVKKIYGSDEATLERDGDALWFAEVPAQSAAVYRLTPH